MRAKAEVEPLPNGWKRRQIGDVVTLSNESGIPTELPQFPFVGMEHIEAQTGRLLSYGDPADFKSSSYIVDTNQVLYGRLRPYLNKVFVPKERCYASREFIPMVLTSEINQNFLLFLLRSSGFVDFAISLNTGDRPRVKWPQMATFEIALPPLVEQEKIVEILEEQFSRLDAALASVRAVREKSERFRRSLLHAAFTGALTGQDTSDGTLPEGWQVSCLGDVAKWGSGGTPKSGTAAFYGGPIKWAVIGDLTESWVTETAQSITNLGLEKSSAKIISPGTVMLAMYGASIGRTGIAAVEMATNQAIAFAVPHDGVLDAQYLLKYLQSQKDDFVRAGQGGAQPNISQTVIKPWPMPLPPLDVQVKIVEILEEQLSRLDAALLVVDVIEKKVSAFRRSLLHAAFSGNLTREWREGAHV
jgi:type I restriction enzyme S subunit